MDRPSFDIEIADKKSKNGTRVSGEQVVEDPAMSEGLAVIASHVDGLKGGIDFARSNLDMQIKRDGKGVPLPVSQQNLDSIRIDGLVPVILGIRSASGVPNLMQ